MRRYSRALYFLYWQMAFHGRQFAARKNKGDARPDATEWLNTMETARGDDLREQLARLAGALSVSWRNQQCAGRDGPLAAWRLAADPARRCSATSGRTTDAGCGRRAVTVLTEYPRLCQPVHEQTRRLCFFPARPGTCLQVFPFPGIACRPVHCFSPGWNTPSTTACF